jgi:hypothetical protein
LASAGTIPTQESGVQAFLESATDESVAEGVTSPELPPIQPSAETATLPELPTVLQNLVPLQPLGSSNPLALATDFSLGTTSPEAFGGQPTNLQRKIAEPPSEQESVVPAFKKAAPTESVAAETIPDRESVKQAFAEPAPAASTEAANAAIHATPTPPTPTAPSEAVAEGITSTESAPVQAFSETEALPELPAILENLALVQPLGASKPLAQHSDFPLGTKSGEGFGGQPTSIQRKPEAASGHSSQDNLSMSSLQTVQVPPVTLDNEPFSLQRFAANSNRGGTSKSNQETRPLDSSVPTRERPSSWSSIAELLGENSTAPTSTSSREPPIQKKSVSSREENPLDLREPSRSGAIPEYSSPFDSTSAFSSKDTAVDSKSAPSKEQDSVSEEASSKEEASQKENSSNDLENLAREIYSLIRQRLVIERERQGRYSSRLPW